MEKNGTFYYKNKFYFIVTWIFLNTHHVFTDNYRPVRLQKGNLKQFDEKEKLSMKEICHTLASKMVFKGFSNTVNPYIE